MARLSPPSCRFPAATSASPTGVSSKSLLLSVRPPLVAGLGRARHLAARRLLHADVGLRQLERGRRGQVQRVRPAAGPWPPACVRAAASARRCSSSRSMSSVMGFGPRGLPPGSISLDDSSRRMSLSDGFLPDPARPGRTRPCPVSGVDLHVAVAGLVQRHDAHAAVGRVGAFAQFGPVRLAVPPDLPGGGLGRGGRDLGAAGSTWKSRSLPSATSRTSLSLAAFGGGTSGRKAGPGSACGRPCCRGSEFAGRLRPLRKTPGRPCWPVETATALAEGGRRLLADGRLVVLDEGDGLSWPGIFDFRRVASGEAAPLFGASPAAARGRCPGRGCGPARRSPGAEPEVAAVLKGAHLVSLGHLLRLCRSGLQNLGGLFQRVVLHHDDVHREGRRGGDDARTPDRNSSSLLIYRL